MSDPLQTFKDVMAIVGPFAGIMIGSFLTYWLSKKSEERRDLKEKQKTDGLNHKYRTLIRAKLVSILAELELVEKNIYTPKFYLNAFKITKIQSIRNDIESGPEIFKPEVLSDLYSTVYVLETFTSELLDSVSKLEELEKQQKEFETYIKGIQFGAIKEIVEKTIQRIDSSDNFVQFGKS